MNDDVVEQALALEAFARSPGAFPSIHLEGQARERFMAEVMDWRKGGKAPAAEDYGADYPDEVES